MSMTIYIFLVHRFLRYKLVVFLAPPIVRNEHCLLCLFPKTHWTYPPKSVIFGYILDELWAFMCRPHPFANTFWLMSATFFHTSCSFCTVMCLPLHWCCALSLVWKIKKLEFKLIFQCFSHYANLKKIKVGGASGYERIICRAAPPG